MDDIKLGGALALYDLPQIAALAAIPAFASQ